MILKYFFFWFGALIIAFANGAMREIIIGKRLGELAAHQISCLTGSVFLVAYSFMLTRRWMPESSRQALNIGFLWLILTVTFEFLFFHLVGKKSWAALFHDYNIFQGRLWILVLISIAIAPYLFFKLRKAA